MSVPKTLQEREKELQALLADSAGRKKLEELETQYTLESGKRKATKASLITYLLVHERLRGLITT